MLTRRVLQVITPSRMSGAEMQLVRMTPHMIARGHDVATIVKRNSPAIAEMCRLGLAPQPRRINGKFSAWHFLSWQTRPASIALKSFNRLFHRQLVERLARAFRRPALDRPRPRLHLGFLAPPSNASACRFQRRETAPGESGNSAGTVHRPAQRDVARRLLRNPRSAHRSGRAWC